jgi:hypothetical protein
MTGRGATAHGMGERRDHGRPPGRAQWWSIEFSGGGE